MKKNIIFVSTALWIGGIESALVNLLNRMDYNKYNVTCLILYDYTDMAHRIPKECRLLIADRNKTVSFKEPYKYSDLFHLMEKPQNASAFRVFVWKVLCLLFKGLEARLYSKYIKEQLKGENFDTAVIYSDVVAETAVRSISAKKFLMFYHHGAMRRVYHDTVGYKKSENIITVSESQAEMLKNFVPKYKEKIITINNIVDVEDILLRSKETPLTQYPENTFNIVSCGRLSKEKGMDLAVSACKELLDKGYSDIQWWIVGGGPAKNELSEQIKALGVEKNVHLLGMQANPYPYIANADLSVQPSRFEGHSVAIMESKILGKPIVATRSAAKEQIQDGVNGALCDTEAKSIAEAITKVLTDKELLKKITDASKSEDFESRNKDILNKLYNIL